MKTKTLEFNGVSQKFCWIPPGKFLMGSPEDEPYRSGNEGPQHEVTITRGFWMADTACTQELWQAVMGNNPSQFKGNNLPVETVNWNDVQGFLSRFPKGYKACLPTEAQWEYTCRAGTQTAFNVGDSLSINQANFNSKETVPVYSFSPNAWGLYQMHGNVLEWCADGRREYDIHPKVNPWGPNKKDEARVFRGGFWSGDCSRTLRSAFRIASHPAMSGMLTGFRFCLRTQF